MKDFWKDLRLFLGAFLLLSGCYSGKSAIKGHGEMNLVWSDEFNYNGLPDSAKWGYDRGDGCPALCGWGNHELQHYTVGRLENARVENGHLFIEARREKTGSSEYSSARLVTRKKADWQYGRIEARAKLPVGRGIWPAFWMLPAQNTYGGWPRNGEIDIMEFVGYQPDTIYGTVHTENFNGMKGTQKSGGIFSDQIAGEWHVFAIEWDADKIDFYFDQQKYHTFINRKQGVDAWPFDQPFYLVLNVAVGGDWGGKKGIDTTAFPQGMLVDYVRVYQKESPATAQNLKK
ncbi:MAG: glycoside hydrolase family 16 protein [Saprospiraceae bacterium]|nr:glycoside hydrolase family 16 protein [Saprospiraceae bacterium]